MADRPLKRWIILLSAGLIALLALAAYVWRIDILRTGLDPKQPFQIYSPPAAPDYAKPSQSQPAAKSAAAPAKASAATAAGGDYVVKAGDALSKLVDRKDGGRARRGRGCRGCHAPRTRNGATTRDGRRACAIPAGRCRLAF